MRDEDSHGTPHGPASKPEAAAEAASLPVRPTTPTAYGSGGQNACAPLPDGRTPSSGSSRHGCIGFAVIAAP